MTGARVPRVLSIAGTDPSGGAGIQADLKTIAALGGYGMSAITCQVAQNTRGVREVLPNPPAFLRAQLDAISDDIDIDAIKLGMLHSTPLIDTVAAWLRETWPERSTRPVVVLDPVMVATSGDRLLEPEAEQRVRELCREVDLVTPNLAELAVLTGEHAVATWDEARALATRLAASTGVTVLLKGGHLTGNDAPDAIVDATRISEIAGERVQTTTTHGTGCSLSSAMATLRIFHEQSTTADAAPDHDIWLAALTDAKAWLTGAIAGGAALHVGGGNGPIDHGHHVRDAALRSLPSAATSWSARAWERIAPIRHAIDACGFVTGLREGTLDAAIFTDYLAQDALYLRDYSRVLARLSTLAADIDEQAFWAAGAHSCLVVERELHVARVGEATETTPASPTTRAYVDNLLARGAVGDYAELVAAVLPCYWLYSALGDAMSAAATPEHPFRDWLLTYADPAFAESTRRAIAIADRVATVTPSAVGRMDAAFDEASRHELAFFEAPLNR